MPARSRPWPIVPRPFDDEAFGSWLGRVAARYRIGVDDLVASAGIDLDLGADFSAWIATPAPTGGAARDLARLSRLPLATIMQMGPQASLGNAGLVYCHRCLFLNPLDVTAPYWKAAWLHAGRYCCAVHPNSVGRISQDVLRNHRNMRRLLHHISRRTSLLSLARR